VAGIAEEREVGGKMSSSAFETSQDSDEVERRPYSHSSGEEVKAPKILSFDSRTNSEVPVAVKEAVTYTKEAYARNKTMKR